MCLCVSSPLKLRLKASSPLDSLLSDSPGYYALTHLQIYSFVFYLCGFPSVTSKTKIYICSFCILPVTLRARLDTCLEFGVAPNLRPTNELRLFLLDILEKKGYLNHIMWYGHVQSCELLTNMCYLFIFLLPVMWKKYKVLN